MPTAFLGKTPVAVSLLLPTITLIGSNEGSISAWKKRSRRCHDTAQGSCSKKEHTLAPERALKVLRRQLDALRKLKNRNCEEAKLEETEWKNFTHNIVEGAFGNPSTPIYQFHAACNAGSHHMTDTQEQLLLLDQENFESRVEAYEALLHSLIETLKLQLPEEGIQGVYNPGVNDHQKVNESEQTPRL